MGKTKRADAVNSARSVGRAAAIKKRCALLFVSAFLFLRSQVFGGSIRDMIAGSKRRKGKEAKNPTRGIDLEVAEPQTSAEHGERE